MAAALTNSEQPASMMHTFFDGTVNGVEVWIVASNDGSHVDAGAWCPGCATMICPTTTDQDEPVLRAENHSCSPVAEPMVAA